MWVPCVMKGLGYFLKSYSNSDNNEYDLNFLLIKILFVADFDFFRLFQNYRNLKTT